MRAITHLPAMLTRAAVVSLVALSLASCNKPAADDAGATDDAFVAFVTNQVADFWSIAKAGCQDAEKDFGISVDVRMPGKASVDEQKRVIEDLMAAGVKGIAISPIDADNQATFLDQVAEKIPLITHDSDAPDCNRIMYIGMDNYAAGRMCGKLVKEAIPDGGKVMLFIGRLEQDNSKHRRQGVIDELLDREANRGNFDAVDKPIEGEKYTILGTITDGGKMDVAKQKAEDAITAYPEMNAMVGLFEYNPPMMYEALKQAGKLGEIALIGFDENDLTLQAIKDGTCVGTVVQNPYQYGYESVRILAALIKGDQSVVPDSKYIDIPPRTINKENVDEFWADLKAKKGTK